MAGPTAKIAVIADTRDLKRTLQSAERDVQSFSDKLRNTGRGLETAGRTMMRSVTLPLVAAGAAGFKMAADLETSFAKIEALVGVSRDEMNGWEGQVRALAKTYGVSANDVADALFYITSAGLRGSVAMETLEAATKASAVGLGEVSTIADLSTSALNAYGANVLSAADATDVLAATVREGKLAPDELAGSMGRVLPIASAMGVQFWEVGAAFAALSRTGTNADEATTQLRGALAGLLKPTSQSQDAMKKLGLSAEGIRRSIRENGLLATLQDLKARIGDNDAEMAKIFPNIRALSGVMDMLGANVEVTEEIFGRMSNTSGLLDDAWEIMADTANVKMKQALVGMKDALITLGQHLTFVVPVFEKMGQAVGLLGDLFAKLPGPVKSLVIAFGGLSAAIGPVLFITGKLMQLGASMIDGWRRVGEAFMGLRLRIMYAVEAMRAGTAAGRAMTASIGLIGIAIAGATALWLHFRQEQERTKRRTENYTAAIKDQTGALEENVDQVTRKELADSKWGKILAGTSANVEVFADAVRNSGDNLDVWSANVDLAANSVNPFSDALAPLISALEDAAGKGDPLAAELLRLRDAGELTDDQLLTLIRVLRDLNNAFEGGLDKEAVDEALGVVEQGARDTADGFSEAEQAANDFETALSDLEKRLKGMIDPVFGYQEAQAKLRQSSDKVTEASLEYLAALEKHGPGTAEAIAALDKLEEAQRGNVGAALDLHLAEQELIGMIRSGEVPFETAISLFEGLAEKGHLSEEALEAMKLQAFFASIQLGETAGKAQELGDKSPIDLEVRTNAISAIEALNRIGGAAQALRDNYGSLGLAIQAGRAAPAPGSAHGGRIPGKMPRLVGELGPEIFIPDYAGTVVPNHEMDKYGPQPATTSQPQTLVEHIHVHVDGKEIASTIRRRELARR
jgi:TP901 family phage tail tape measure protein